MTDAYIWDAMRTPFGRYGGPLSSIRTDDRAARQPHRTGGCFVVCSSMCISVGQGQGIAVVIEKV